MTRSTPQTAGSPFTVYATAYDQFGNIKTNYPGGGDTQSFSGLANSPIPSNTPPSYGAITWGSGTGQGSASITAFAAGSTLNLTDTATSKTGTSTFTVLPGPLFRFRWTDQPGASQIAGVAFDSVAATAYDQWDNVKTNYVPAATFSGLSPSLRGCNADNTAVNPAGTSGCNPIYGFTWLAGVATSTTVKDYKAEATQLTVTDGSISASSDSGTPDAFTVAPNEANVPPTFFSEQPTLTERNTTINDTTGVKVTVLDQFGNPRSGQGVSVAIDANPSSGTLTCPTSASPCTATTNASGVATFLLRINTSGLGYTLKATTTGSPPLLPAWTTSSAFDIANDVNPCEGTCEATGTTGTVSATTTASGLGSGALASRFGPAAAAAPGDARLGMTVNPSVQVPASVCGTGFQQRGDGFGVSTVRSGVDKPSFKVVATIDKTVVKASGKTDVSLWNVCLGAFNVTNPPPGTVECSNATTSNSWRTKNGTCAVLNGGFYWGLVADYPSSVKNCPTAIGSNRFPGVLKRNKTNAGDVVITFCVPYPWDEKGGFG